MTSIQSLAAGRRAAHWAFVILIGALFAWVGGGAPAAANPNACRDYAKTRTTTNSRDFWSGPTLSVLCNDAPRSAEPAKCFARMRAFVSRSVQGDWRAVWVCAGTVDANARVRCFVEMRAAKVSVANATRRCLKTATVRCPRCKAAPPRAVSAASVDRSQLVPPGAPGRRKIVEPGPVAATGAAPTPRHACGRAVQGQIAWNYSGETRWGGSNIEKLCRGATSSVQPARCFVLAMHGGVEHGRGTRWRWQDAVALCAGARNSASTIACFETQIGQGRSQADAIRRCKR